MQKGLSPRRPTVTITFYFSRGWANRILLRKANRDLIEGLLGNSSIQIINIQYVDNTLIFSNCNIHQATLLKGIMRCFELWLGLSINYHKSSLIILSERSLTSEFIFPIFGCRKESLPVSYLGIPIKNRKLTKREWGGLIDKIERRLERWKVRCLTGRKINPTEFRALSITYIYNIHIYLAFMGS